MGLPRGCSRQLIMASLSKPIVRRWIGCWWHAPNMSLMPRPSRRASSRAPARISTPASWRDCARFPDRFMAGRAIVSSGCWRKSKSGTRVERCIAAFQEKHSLPPGFGHGIYPEGDPRAVLLKKTALTIARRRGRKLMDTALKDRGGGMEPAAAPSESRFLPDGMRADAGLLARACQRRFSRLADRPDGSRIAWNNTRITA